MKIIPPEILLDAYSQGIFPMADSKESDDVNWYSSQERGVIPIDGFHVSKNIKRIIRQGRFSFKINTQFGAVMEECANRDETWINDLILNSYQVLHEAGNAHSVEVFNNQGELAGGLYGVTLGSAFFGESMFHIDKEADKVALFHCHQILQQNGFTLWDTQFYTDHLGRFGCIKINADDYVKLLNNALQKESEFTI